MNSNLDFSFSYSQLNTNSSTSIVNKQRNLQIEERIRQRRKNEFNPYGGTGMDGNSKEELMQNMKNSNI
jgi:hypothetical protein